jgi:hypothetical protein
MGAFAGADAPDIRAFADTAQAQGIKVIWTLNSAAGRASLIDSMPKLAARCGCRDEDTMLAYVIGMLRAYPSTWGYYIADEPAPADHDKVAAFANRVRALDPVHERLVMGCGLCYGGEKSVSFLTDVDATLGTDAYPVQKQGPDQPVVADRVGTDAEGLQRVADRAGRKTVVALQAWRWGDSYYDAQSTGLGEGTRFPTRREIEMQRNAAITHGRPELILWYTLTQVIGWEPGQRPWWWAEPADAGQRWANLVGGAFAPLSGPNERPVARFTLRARRTRRALRVTLDAGRSYDPDGSIVRYRWRSAGKPRLCTRRRCSLKLRRGAKRTVQLTVTDSGGARASQRRRIRVSRRGAVVASP